jgi:tetraacyldisaccharide 4'-kinase
MRTPDFWRRGQGGLNAMMLAPFGWIYGFVSESRISTVEPWRVAVKVVCVGNLVAGGAGKTPVAASIAKRLLDAGSNPHFLSRGYGGTSKGPLLVEPGKHRSADVGDEPLLLARLCPTWVAVNRQRGCEAAAQAGAGVVVMDDGHQNPVVAKDLSIVVFDGGFGFGNGHAIPAGPLREPAAFGLRRADAVVIIGKDVTGIAEDLEKAGYQGPVLTARVEPTPEARELSGKPVIAFAGIGRPDKFLSTLRSIGCDVRRFHSFPDHHVYAAGEISTILDEAETFDAQAVSTEKDWVRLPDDVKDRVTAVGVTIAWDDEAALDALLSKVSGV